MSYSEEIKKMTLMDIHEILYPDVCEIEEEERITLTNEEEIILLDRKKELYDQLKKLETDKTPITLNYLLSKIGPHEVGIAFEEDGDIEINIMWDDYEEVCNLPNEFETKIIVDSLFKNDTNFGQGEYGVYTYVESNNE